MFDLIAFDADDTLWENEAHYEQARKKYHRILSRYPLPDNVGIICSGAVPLALKAQIQASSPVLIEELTWEMQQKLNQLPR